MLAVFLCNFELAVFLCDFYLAGEVILNMEVGRGTLFRPTLVGMLNVIDWLKVTLNLKVGRGALF